MRYIGSKTKLLEHIENVLKNNCKDSLVFCDIFAGTGSVGNYFKHFFKIISNDLLYFSYSIQKGLIENNVIPKFNTLGFDPITFFNNIDEKDIFFDKEPFILNNYTLYKSNRNYFSIENARIIDFFRQKISFWLENKMISEKEFFYLLMCLLDGTSKVANITGTYGAYLKKLDKNSTKKIFFNNQTLNNNNLENKSYNLNANELIKNIQGDILYLDPPYNSRQYLPNYHVLETISRYDYPEIYGKTGLRPYDKQKSNYCSKINVLKDFEELVSNANFKYIVLSYSNEGIMKEEEIEKILKKYGKESTYKLYKIPHKRFKSNTNTKKTELNELIFFIEKSL